MSRAFKKHMQSADPRDLVAEVHSKRPTSVALRGSKLHLLSDIREEQHGGDGGGDGEDQVGGPRASAEETFIASAARSNADLMQTDMVAKFSRQWIETQINLLVGVIARIGTACVDGRGRTRQVVDWRSNYSLCSTGGALCFLTVLMVGAPWLCFRRPFESFVCPCVLRVVLVVR
jgi:hypothetical protein